MIMKQFGIILVSLGVMLFISCSKDDMDYTAAQPTTETETANTPYGIYEGEWQLSKYGKTCPGTIEVDSTQIRFDVPADYLLPRLGLVDETTKAEHPDEPFYTTTSDYTYSKTSQVMRYSTLGYSTTALYIQNEGFDSQDTPQGEKSFSFGVKADDTDYTVSLFSLKEEPTAVFDLNTNLWKLAIPIDKASIYNRQTSTEMTVLMLDQEAPDKSAWLFVFRAKKKIK